MAPLWEIITGRDCNLRCSYCYDHEKAAGCNTQENVEAFLRAAYAEYLQKHPSVAPTLCFIGGEPLLHPELIDAALTVWHDLNRKYRLSETRCPVITNGTLIAESKNVQALLEKWSHSLRFSFSIDGTQKTHDAFRVDLQGNGSWNRAIEGYKIARQFVGESSCRAKATFSRETVTHFSDGVIELFEQGFSIVHATTMYEICWNEEETPYVYSLFRPLINYLLEHERFKRLNFRPLPIELPETGCMTMNRACSCYQNGSMCLGLNGLVYGCHRMACASRLRPHRKVTKSGFEEISPELPRIGLNVWKYRPEKCRSCFLGAVCIHCANSIFEYDFDDLTAFHKVYSPCGWTKGMYAAQLDFARRVQALGGR